MFTFIFKLLLGEIEFDKSDEDDVESGDEDKCEFDMNWFAVAAAAALAAAATTATCWMLYGDELEKFGIFFCC